jgi:hypothetical protein
MMHLMYISAPTNYASKNRLRCAHFTHCIACQAVIKLRDSEPLSLPHEINNHYLRPCAGTTFVTTVQYMCIPTAILLFGCRASFSGLRNPTKKCTPVSSMPYSHGLYRLIEKYACQFNSPATFILLQVTHLRNYTVLLDNIIKDLYSI